MLLTLWPFFAAGAPHLIARPTSFRVPALDRSHLDPAPASKQLGTTHGQMPVEGPVEVRALEML
jgi:hypothetical protein